MAQHIAIIGVAFVFITVGLANRARGKGPWRAFVYGGVAMTVAEVLDLLGIIHM